MVASYGLNIYLKPESTQRSAQTAEWRELYGENKRYKQLHDSVNRY
jgi:hypothetical protein